MPVTSQNLILFLQKHYKLSGTIQKLPGELDFNYKLICTPDSSYLVKIYRSNRYVEFIDYMYKIHDYLSGISLVPETHIPLKTIEDEIYGTVADDNGQLHKVQVFKWINGRLWSDLNPVTDSLLTELGMKSGKLTAMLLNFEHRYAHRTHDWDLAQLLWVEKYDIGHTEPYKQAVNYFIKLFKHHKQNYANLRKSIVHNDINDNNIIINTNLVNPEIVGFIDFGDSVYTQLINDLAITITYAVTGKNNPLESACKVVSGYHYSMPLTKAELDVLYMLVGARLVISFTKSGINLQTEPENTYLQVSRAAISNLLLQWYYVNNDFATYCFREACGFNPVPNYPEFVAIAQKNNVKLTSLFPNLEFNMVKSIDLSITSNIMSNEYSDNDYFNFFINRYKKQNPNYLIAGGYHEIRPFYTTEAYKVTGNECYEYRSTHAGIDFWADADTAVAALFDGIVVSAINNNSDKDYGPTIILQHTLDSLVFYTLYGHLSVASLTEMVPGKIVKRGQIIGFIGQSSENGNWVPHLHFQVMLNLLNYKDDFPGVFVHKQKAVWEQLAPNPNLFFNLPDLVTISSQNPETILKARKELLGYNLSVSYLNPLYIVKGDDVYLIDYNGNKFLDTVNNVPHVGHQHPVVVEAGQHQMAVLNTNTRYLHPKLTEFASELTATLPKELSVVYFVNSGSEANELALRMAKTCTEGTEYLVMEMGYHGNTNACIDISPYKFDRKGGKGKPEHTHIIPLPHPLRGMYSGADGAHKYAMHVHQFISQMVAENRKPAAFIAESIISCGGQIELPPGFLNEVYTLVRKAGGLCIADEVQTGLGRVGHTFWAFQLHNVVPDIVTIGKPLGNGHPLAAVICTPQVAAKFNNGMEYFNTFGGNPVSCAIGLSVLQIIKKEQLQVNVLNTGNYFTEQLLLLKQQFPVIADVRGKGLFLGIELADLALKPLPEKTRYLVNRLREKGVLTGIDGADNNVIKIKPPLTFNKIHTDIFITALKLVLSEDAMQLD